MKTLMVMAGGTGGHVYPALAVAGSLIERGVHVVWMGTRTGLESKVVPAQGINLEWVEVKGLRGSGWISLLQSPVMLVRALCQAVCVIRRRRPDALLGMGGYVSGPGGLAGVLMRLPLVIHEANARAGLSNRLLAHSASHVLTGFPATIGLSRPTEWVGNPVRPSIVAIESPERRAIGQRDLLRLLVIGGSQGAEILNRLVPAAILELPPSERPEIVHQCGKAGPQDTIQRYRGLGIEAEVVEYIDDISAAYRNADLVICRSGAMTVAEIAAAGVAALLVPFPYAVGDHQSMNAAFLAEHGAARVIPQTQLSSVSLARVLKELLNDRSKLLALAHAARSLACPDATERVADFCLEAMGA
jgi:UDP-N-acetylglucosamine--N-acetylmuramyl-(pentapeptide) pyrophosphoryl-undecaprenol N-acetylglucosamine transferase